MPPLLERPKMTRAMYEALKRHIMREREKKKQEQEQDEMMERLRRERDLKKKKEEEDNLTLEQTNEQIIQLEKKLEALKQEKNDIYLKLKKASSQETETIRAKQKEQSELAHGQSSYSHPVMAGVPQSMYNSTRPILYKSGPNPLIPTGMKRQRSPSPPPSSVSSYANYGQHSEAKYLHTQDGGYVPHPAGGSSGGGPGGGSGPGEGKYQPSSGGGHPETKYMNSPYQPPSGKGRPVVSTGHLYTAQHPSQPGDFKPSVYQPGSQGHIYTASQAAALQQQVATAAVISGAGGSYPSGQSSVGGKYPGPGQSAFTSYQNQFPQSHPQKALAEQFPAAYPIQRMQQPGYHANIQLQQSLEHASQKQAGFDDKYKHSQAQIRGLVPTQQSNALMSQAIQLQQQQQQQAKSKPLTYERVQTSGAFVQGYPARSQPGGPPPSSYPSATTSTTYSNPSNVQQGRPGFGARYY